MAGSLTETEVWETLVKGQGRDPVMCEGKPCLSVVRKDLVRGVQTAETGWWFIFFGGHLKFESWDVKLKGRAQRSGA